MRGGGVGAWIFWQNNAAKWGTHEFLRFYEDLESESESESDREEWKSVRDKEW